jgi:hypothetical protein
MLISISRKLETEWTSVNEDLVGVVDGKNREFLVPEDKPRELLILRDLIIVAPDSRIRERNTEGTLIVDEPDGYSLTEREEGGVLVTFERAPRIGTVVGFCALGRRLETSVSFAVKPLTQVVQKHLEERGKPFQKRIKNRKAREEDTTLTEAVEPSREAFLELVQDWTGVSDGGKPVDCTDDTKGAFLDQLTPLDSLAFCNIVVERAVALQRERLRTREADVKN